MNIEDTFIAAFFMRLIILDFVEKWKQLLNGALERKCFKHEVKILEKYPRRSSFFNKVVGCRSETLLKVNLFPSIFQVF